MSMTGYQSRIFENAQRKARRMTKKYIPTENEKYVMPMHVYPATLPQFIMCLLLQKWCSYAKKIIKIKVTHVKFGDGEVILMSRTAIGSDQGREKLFGLDNGTVFFSPDQTILLSTATEKRVPSYSPTLMQAMTCGENN